MNISCGQNQNIKAYICSTESNKHKPVNKDAKATTKKDIKFI